jgi:hypothetical protein
MEDNSEQRPNKNEILFLNHSYDFFLDIYKEIFDKTFWENNSYYRFNRIRDAFLVYSEVLDYQPVDSFLESLKKVRPPMEAELSKDYLLFIRNLLIHFPFYKSWDDIKFTKELINWSEPGKTIDKFLSKYAGHSEVKYRMWNFKTKDFTYVSINFHPLYIENIEIKLIDFMPEKEGILFVMSLMHHVLMSQVETILGDKTITT